MREIATAAMASGRQRASGACRRINFLKQAVMDMTRERDDQ